MAYQAANGNTTLIGRMRAHLEDRDVSDNVQKAWLYWARALLLFHEGRSAETLQLEDIKEFITHLEGSRRLSPATRRQSMMAIRCLLHEVLGLDIPGLEQMVARCRRENRPVVLSPHQVQKLLSHLHGRFWLMGSLVYGAGLRLRECVRLRVRDIETDRIVIRDSNGRFNRESVLPNRVRDPLREHLEDLKLQHIRELADGLGSVKLPPRIKPVMATSRSWAWQFVFPGPYSRSVSGHGPGQQRDHIPDLDLAGAIEKAARDAGIERRVTANTLRNSFATHLIQRGVAVADVERLLGINNDSDEAGRQHMPSSSIPTSPADLLATH
jgi:integrase